MSVFKFISRERRVTLAGYSLPETKRFFKANYKKYKAHSMCDLIGQICDNWVKEEKKKES